MERVEVEAVVYAGANDVELLAQRSHDGGLDCSGDKGMTKQSFKEECDINTIVKRFGIGNPMLPEGGVYPWTNNDFTGISDFRSALEQVVLAEDSFMQLPASVRIRFDNNPAKFVDFCSNPDNLKEMAEMGLATKRLEPAPVKVEVVGAPTGGASSAGGTTTGSGS